MALGSPAPSDESHQGSSETATCRSLLASAAGSSWRDAWAHGSSMVHRSKPHTHIHTHTPHTADPVVLVGFCRKGRELGVPVEVAEGEGRGQAAPPLLAAPAFPLRRPAAGDEAHPEEGVQV